MTAGFFSPLPPARTVVADYAAALLAELRRHGRGEVAPARSDAALYHLGNNGLHAGIYRRALASPGVVVLHDAVLNHFFLGQLSETEYVDEFVYNYGEWNRALGQELWRARATSEAQSDGLGSRLKGAEEFVGLRHAGAGIAEMDRYQVAFHRRGYAHFANRAAFQSLRAVARQIDEDLQQAVVVGLHQRQCAGHLPDQRNAGLAQCRFDHDSDLVERGAQIRHHGLALRGGVQARRRDFLQPADQSPQHLVLIVALNRP